MPGTLCFGPEQEDRLLQEVGLWNDGGQCVTFWSDGSAQAVEEEILSIMEDRGIAVDELCELVRDPDDPYSPLSEWNATFLDVVAEALGNLYGSGAPKHTWPPQEGLSPEWMHEAWTRAEAVASERVCGIQSPFT